MEDKDTLDCDACGTSLIEDESYQTEEDRTVCSDCFRTCERCSTTGDVGNEEYHYVDCSEYWCQDCTDSYANWCDSCNEWTSGYTSYIDDRNENFCESCTSDYATYCEDCDTYTIDGCDSCEDNIQVIHDYGYRPDPIFHSTDKEERLYFGIEIEMESPQQDTYVLREAAEYASTLEGTDHAYLKSDGSLNCGMELVTHPMSHSYYRHEASELWDVLETLRTKYKMRAWDASTCGLHIHISRTGFSGGAHMHRFLNLVYSNEEFFGRMAGRNSSRWAKFDDVVRKDWTGDKWKEYKSFKDKLEDNGRTDRYSAVNTNNRHTLEMRIFKSSVNMDTVMSQISLAHASVEYTRRLSVQDIKDGALSHERLIEYITANAELYPELTARLERVLQPATV